MTTLIELCKKIEAAEAAGRCMFDDDIIGLVQELVDCTALIQDVAKQLVECDSYLRAIQAEELDGSEPALGPVLDANAGLWPDLGQP